MIIKFFFSKFVKILYTQIKNVYYFIILYHRLKQNVTLQIFQALQCSHKTNQIGRLNVTVTGNFLHSNETT